MDANQFESAEKKSFLQGIKKILFFTEIGFLEAVFVFTLLVLLFGTLNFFNILPLPTAFPFLSTLPHLQKSTPDITSSYLQSRLSINLMSQAKKAFSSYLTQTLQSKFLPSTNSTITVATSAGVIKYTFNWISNSTFFSTSVNYPPHSSKPSYFNLVFLIPQSQKFNTSLKNAQEEVKNILAKYFTVNPSLLLVTCTPHLKTIFCQQFISSSQNTIGYSILGDIRNSSTSVATNSSLTIFSCLSPLSKRENGISLETCQ